MVNGAGDITFNENTRGLSENIYNCLWGRILVIYSLGDSDRLPPVMMKTVYSAVGKPGNSDLVGQIFFATISIPRIKIPLSVLS